MGSVHCELVGQTERELVSSAELCGNRRGQRSPGREGANSRREYCLELDTQLESSKSACLPLQATVESEQLTL